MARVRKAKRPGSCGLKPGRFSKICTASQFCVMRCLGNQVPWAFALQQQHIFIIPSEHKPGVKRCSPLLVRMEKEGFMFCLIICELVIPTVHSENTGARQNCQSGQSRSTKFGA